MTLTFTVTGPPQGARRHRVQRRGKGVHVHHTDDHLAAERRLMLGATYAIGVADWQTTSDPVRVTIDLYQRRPQDKAKARKWWPSPEAPFRGKPDTDNAAKLIMDACTKAGVWTDDTVVADLVVRRRYVAVDAMGQQGEPHTRVLVEMLEPEPTRGARE